MKLTDFFEYTGKPFTYYPGFVHYYGISVNAAVLLCYIGWKVFEDSKNEWRALTTSDITEATGLTVKEQSTAREKLTANGLIEEYYARLEHTLKFRLKDPEINRKSPNAEREDAPVEHTPGRRMANLLNGVSSKGQLQDNKKEQTKEGANAPALVAVGKTQKLPPIPESLNTPRFETAWESWIADRKERKKIVTWRAAEIQLKKMAAWGEAKAIQAIENAIAGGWQGVFEPREERQSTNNYKRQIKDENPHNFSGVSL